jgi:hypothetical protein
LDDVKSFLMLTAETSVFMLAAEKCCIIGHFLSFSGSMLSPCTLDQNWVTPLADGFDVLEMVRSCLDFESNATTNGEDRDTMVDSDLSGSEAAVGGGSSF